MKKRNNDGKRGKTKNIKYMSFVLPLLFCSLTMVLFGRYRLFLQDYENRLIQTQKEIFKDPPVSELYANVISKYGNLIKNSTRWVYTSLESYRQQQFQEDLLVGEQDNIKRIKMGRRLKFGLGKEVFDAEWNDHKVAYVRLRPERLHQGPIRDRVRTGIQHLIQLQPSPYVTKVLGFCFEGHNSIMISELAPFGDLKDFINTRHYSELNPLGRLGIAIRLVRVFAFMHNSPIGKRINCDMTKVTRALSQFLVTEDYRIVANDLDDLPEVIPDNLPNCTWGKIEDRDPSFQSPEEKSYSPNNPSPFTDKADVWKLVNMTKFIMYKYANGAKERAVTQLLEPISDFLDKCQSKDPDERPSAVDLVKKLIQTYRKAANFL